ncbi:hypothetical protein CROQUDRAFT_47479 [Cronartium quercuum f. sp. fusiforme G11]|uniref:Laccase n=1 Tax=Cronartium quercuum f. sp. fusiforme G11 TaxID=708437 RepID=A0A9P6TA60_9BASI|nr:hypothetical protein CROQUDRAFT_47479 [Cronartium quercuum f. sp. fusiforme G11]
MNVWAKVKVNSPELYLSPKFQINSVAQTRTYFWTVTNETAALDGFKKNVLVINSQFPGPLIEANVSFDTIVVTLTNLMSDSVSIHWHGVSIYQNGTPWMDGVTGVTQCPIPPGSSFTYTFTIKDQFGTFWYHAHTQGYSTDGIAGPLIVHSVDDPLKRGVDYNQDVILFVNDWYHNMSARILEEALSPEGYMGSIAAPSPNSALINGIGYFDCKYADSTDTCTTLSEPLTLDLVAGQKARIRLIGAGSHAMFRFSADGHTLNVTEADATGVAGPTAIHRVPFHNGERYSVIIDLANDSVGSTFYLRAAMDTDCWAWLAPGMNESASTARAIVRAVNPSVSALSTNVTTPTTSDWSDSVSGPCVDLDPGTLVPLVEKAACTNVLGRVFYQSSFGFLVKTVDNATTMEGRFFVNDTTWLTYTYKPLLSHMLVGGSGFLNSSEVASFTMPTADGCYDIVINNLDPSLDHSYHLRKLGVGGKIVARGSGTLDSTTAASLTYNTGNPLRRDVSAARVRVVANNPGLWILHCHIGKKHLGAGFAGMFVMQPSALRELRLPIANAALCAGATPSTISTIEPGRRKRHVARRSSF